MTALKALGDARQRAHALDGRGADQLHRAGRRQADLRRSATDEMEMGVGIHGEPGRRRVKLTAAPTPSPRRSSRAIVGDLGDGATGQALLFVNGFGGTPLMELYLMYDAARRILEKRGVKIARSLVGNYVTSLDMAGCSITLTLLDDEMTALWDAPVHTAALRW